MAKQYVERSLTTGAQLGFETAYRITAGVGIMISIVRHIYVAAVFTLVTTVIAGVAYPMLVTGVAQVLFPVQAGGSLVKRNGLIVGSSLIGQPFAGPGYFWPRPSAAGKGYDAAASGGSNLGPTNAALVSRVAAERDRLRATNPGVPIPIELVTTSGSGLDPHLSPAGVAFQLPRVARERGMDEGTLRQLAAELTEPRQFGFLGEPRVNILVLNLALDERYPRSAKR